MQVQWQKFLKQLGVKAIDGAEYQICPFHTTLNEPTLEIHHHPVTGWYHFRCIHSKCQFDGDAVTLIAKLHDLSIEDAVHAFTRPPLSNCLKDTLLDSEIQDYLNHYRGQAEVQNYLDRCSQDLQTGNNGSVLRHRIQNLDLKTEYLPKSMARVASIDPPRCLAIFSKPNYRKGQFLLFPYVFEGQITELIAQQLDQSGTVGSREHIRLNRSGLGVFPVENLATPEERLIVCEDPLAAARLTKSWKFKSNSRPPIVSALRFPLPRVCANKILILADTLEYPLSLRFGLNAYTCPNAIHDAPKKARVYVATRRQPLKPESSIHGFGESSAQRVSLGRWLAGKIKQLVTDNQIDVVVLALQAIELADQQRDELLGELATISADDTTIQLVTDAHIQGRSELILANNMRIVKRPDGMYGLSVKGAETRLSNVLIRIDARVVTAEKGMAYECSFKHADSEIVSGRLTEADFKSADKLQSSITHHFVTQSSNSPYIACYAGGQYYKWPDIANKLAEGVPALKEIETLGLSPDLRVHFPNFVIDPAQPTLQEQEHIFTLNQSVQDCYAGLTPNNNAAQSMEIVRKVVAGCDDMYIGAFVAGVCQLIYTVLVSQSAQLKGRQTPRVHLCYAEPESGIWAPTLHNLQLLFSDSMTVPYIGDNAKQHLGQLTPLGALPYIGYLPSWSVRRLPGLMQTSPVNLVTRLDGSDATALAGEATVGFVIPADYRASDVNSIHTDDVLELQTALPEFLRYLLNFDTPSELTRELRHTGRPAYAAYRIACAALDLPEEALMDEMINEFYTAMGAGSVQAFCLSLNRILYKDAEFQPQNPYGVEIVNGPPTTELLRSKNPPLVFLMDDVVLLNKRSVALAMRVTRELAFNPAALTQEFKAQDYLRPLPSGINVDENLYWTLSRHMWDRYIKQEQLILVEPVSSGDIIPLGRLTA